MYMTTAVPQTSPTFTPDLGGGFVPDSILHLAGHHAEAVNEANEKPPLM
jgi:hypothetical protein